MALVNTLLQNADLDRDLLRGNLERGDSPEAPRDVDFVLYAKDKEKGELICSFVHDNSYGRALYQEILENPEVRRHRIVVTIHMPTTEHVTCTASAFMACLAELFNLDYDGWGSPIMNQKT